ncbi:TM2 domain-containing protein [Catellatospora sp. KI3]|uniref:TM2 domain-containing protein n=1 Tax=Catellatospora sp. KI3 TaxID=3041620 RepID=UPI002482411E|nr:TM2 domain-containing protein [Catellatospora sp. KI3]MDI1461804.1 TM2 domain-containing protein [Catellatospora sp. KI3]
MTYPPPQPDPYQPTPYHQEPAQADPYQPTPHQLEAYQPDPYQPYAIAPASVGGYATSGYPGGPGVSDKSKVAAGLLQLLPGFFMGLGGIGRLYAGHNTIGILQICASVVGWISFWCGIFLNIFVLFIPFLIYGAIWLWFVIDGIIMLAGNPVDGQGRPLRP